VAVAVAVAVVVAVVERLDEFIVGSSSFQNIKKRSGERSPEHATSETGRQWQYSVADPNNHKNDCACVQLCDMAYPTRETNKQDK